MGSHSAITAEGDNKVLMQKVVKDILTDVRKKRHDSIKFTQKDFKAMRELTSISNNLEALRDLIYMRENVEIKNILETLKKQVLEKEKKFFNVWMSDINDEIQDVAESFGERYFLQNAWKAYDYLGSSHNAGTKTILFHVLRMHMVDYLRDNISFFLINDLISKEAAKELVDSFDQVVKDFVPYMNDCLHAFNLPNVPQMHAEMSRDKYWQWAGGVAKDSPKLFKFTEPAEPETSLARM
jgi:acyl-CoA oxidase